MAQQFPAGDHLESKYADPSEYPDDPASKLDTKSAGSRKSEAKKDEEQQQFMIFIDTSFILLSHAYKVVYLSRLWFNVVVFAKASRCP